MRAGFSCPGAHPLALCCFLLGLLAFSSAHAAPELWQGMAVEGCDPLGHPNFTIILPHNVDLTIHTSWAMVAVQKSPTSYKSQDIFDTGGAYASLCNDKDASCASTKSVVLINRIDGQTVYGSFNIVSDKKVRSAEFSAELKHAAKPPSCGS